MPEYTVKISDEGDKVIQLAFTAENVRLGDAAYASVNDFLTAQIVKEFGISEDELAALAKQQAIDGIVSGLQQLTPEEMQPIIDATTTAVSTKVPPIKDPPIKTQP